MDECVFPVTRVSVEAASPEKEKSEQERESRWCPVTKS